MSFSMYFSLLKITLIKFFILSLMLCSGIAFAEDDTDLQSIENEEIIEQDNDLDGSIENETFDEAEEQEEFENPEDVEEEQFNEPEEHIDEEEQDQSMDMDQQEREHFQQIEDLESAYTTIEEYSEQDSGDTSQVPDDVQDRNNRSNRIYSDRPKRSKAEKEFNRSQREERRAKHENTERDKDKWKKRKLDTKYQNRKEAYEAPEELHSDEQSIFLYSGNKQDVDSENFECDPIVHVEAQNKPRFDILKELADEHGFEITILESENKIMSLEKNLPLSKVVESITRDMSVVLNFQTMNDCNRLIEIAVLDNDEWGNSNSNFSSSRSGISGGDRLQRYKPKTKIKIKKREQEDIYEEFQPLTEEELEAKELQEERNARRLERKNLRSLNDELENGDELKAQYNVRGDNWKKDINDMRVEIPDMEQYVQEVINGERQPDLRKMSIKQRSEYMKIRRELRSQQ